MCQRSAALYKNISMFIIKVVFSKNRSKFQSYYNESCFFFGSSCKLYKINVFLELKKKSTSIAGSSHKPVNATLTWLTQYVDRTPRSVRGKVGRTRRDCHDGSKEIMARHFEDGSGHRTEEPKREGGGWESQRGGRGQEARASKGG